MVGGYDEQMPWTGLEEWIFGCTLLGTVLASLHLRKIGFDYRVRRDSMAVKTCPHLAELANYALGKPEASYYKLLREKDEEVENLRARTRSTKGSYSYRQEADYLLQAPIAGNCGAVFTKKMPVPPP